MSMMIQTVCGDFLQFRKVVGIFTSVDSPNDVVAMMVDGSNHIIHHGEQLVDFELKEKVVRFICMRNITDQVCTQYDINKHIGK